MKIKYMPIKLSNTFAKINESRLAKAPKRIDAVPGTYNINIAFSAKIDTLQNLLKNLISMTDIDEMIVNKSCELTDKKESFEGIYGGDEKRCNYRVYDDSPQDMETLFAKFCDEALENSPYSEITYPELYAIWNKWVNEKNYTNICRNIGIGGGGKDTRHFLKYVRAFFKVESKNVSRAGLNTKMLTNIAKKGSPQKKADIADWT